MGTRWHYIALLGCLALTVTAQDDSIINNSTETDTTVLRSVLSNSELTNSTVELSKVSGSRAQHSKVIYSVLNNSVISDSIVDAKYRDLRLTDASTAEVFSRDEEYFFNRIYDSEIIHSLVDISKECDSFEIMGNSTVYQSHIIHSRVHRSMIIKSNLKDNSGSCSSLVGMSNLQGSAVQNSVVRKLSSSECMLMNSVVEVGQCEHSKFLNSKLYSSNIVESSVANSRVFGGSILEGSNIQNSQISYQSKVTKSEVMNSNVSNSNITNCIIINSSVVGKTLDSVTMMNGMIFHDK